MDGQVHDSITLLQVSSKPHVSLIDTNPIVNMFMSQYSLKNGIYKCGIRAEKDIQEDIVQLHERGSFLPIMKEDIPTGDLNNVLESHMFLKNNRDDTIKGRLVAVEINNAITSTKNDVSSPTTSTESH